MLEWYGATSEVSWLFLLAAWVLALIAACAVYSMWNRAGLGMRLTVHQISPAPDSPAAELPELLMRSGPYPAPIFEGDGIALEIALTTSGGSRGPAWLKGDVAGTELARATGIVPRRGWSQLETFEKVRRGPLGASGWILGSSDPLGLFQSRRGCLDVELGLVLPRFSTLAAARDMRELEASVAAPRAGSGNEVFGVREYRPGDSLRRIHWRSSARHSQLVVREYEPPGVRTLNVYVDPSPPSREVADQIARIAASETWECIQDGGRVVLWAPGADPSPNPRDLWSQLEWLARYPDDRAGAFGANSPSPGDELVIVLATPNVELLAAAEGFRQRRGWVVGDADVEADMPLRRTGTSWPL